MRARAVLPSPFFFPFSFPPPSHPKCDSQRDPAHFSENGEGRRKEDWICCTGLWPCGAPRILFKKLTPLQHQHQIHKTTMPSKGVGADTCSEVESIGRLKCKKLDPEVVEGARRMRHEAAAPRKCPAPGGLTRPPAPPRGPQRIVDSTAAAAAAPNRYCLQAFVRGARRMRHAAAVPHQDPAPGPCARVPHQSPAPGLP